MSTDTMPDKARTQGETARPKDDGLSVRSTEAGACDMANNETPETPIQPPIQTIIEIDEDARDTLDRYFYENPLSPIRIYINTGSAKGPRLAMKPCAQSDSDLAFEAEDYTFLISPHLVGQLGNIRIAAYDMGFQVIPQYPLGQRANTAEV